jgi:ubiquinone/menaquinone biosynthesis C-methylase UbiE
MITRNRLIQTLYDATYGKFIFAGAYDRFIRNAEAEGLSESRRQLVSHSRGSTLEIATGTGLNLAHYPERVTDLTLTEPYPHMLEVLRRKVELSGRRNTTVVQAEAEHLPFPNCHFDTVVATMILCSAEDPTVVLKEIARVLRPNGKYLFLEHIRNQDPTIAKRQDRIQPGWYLFGNGCHCNRDTVTTLRGSQLVIEELNYGKIPRAWSIVEQMITGRAGLAA